MSHSMLVAIAGGAGAAILVANGMAMTFSFVFASARDVLALRRREEWRKEVLGAWRR